MVLSSASLPEWCEQLTFTSSFLFPFETRQLYFYCTAFGSSRYILHQTAVLLLYCIRFIQVYTTPGSCTSTVLHSVHTGIFYTRQLYFYCTAFGSFRYILYQAVVLLLYCIRFIQVHSRPGSCTSTVLHSVHPGTV